MGSKRPLPELKYSPEHLPPRVSWRLAVQVPRNELGSLCEQLHSIVRSRGGASFYYPDLDNDKTRCRYEWHRRLNRHKFALRVGIVIDVSNADLKEIEAYVTTKEAAESLSGPVPELQPDTVAEIQQEVVATLEQANSLRDPENQTDYFCVFHIETPPHHGFRVSVSSNDATLRFVRTRVVKDKRISAIIVKARGGSKEIAKDVALSVSHTACALLTLAEWQRYEHTSLIWPRYRPALPTVPSPNDVTEDRLYPRRKLWPPLEETDAGVIDRFDLLWKAYLSLSEADRKVFQAALFAYYAGTPRNRNSSTLSVVAFSAALSSLSEEFKKKCDGSLTCSFCGPIAFRHDIVGEVAAIVDLVGDVCEVKREDQLADVRRVIQRVYRKQRSAFVHGAVFRHEEYGQGSGVPPHVPTNDAPVQELFEYEQDLESISRIARRTLLQWLARRGNFTLDFEQFGINTDRITAKSLLSMHISFAGAGVVGFAMAEGSKRGM
jgi:hypothetical protein